MFNYNINRSFFVLICDEENIELSKINKFLRLLSKSGVGSIINNYVKSNSQGGRPQYNQYNMLALVLYSFAFSTGSLRDMEEKCTFDTRYMYLSNNIKPTYVSISNFINDVIIPNIDKIFSLITKSIFLECGLSMDDAFIDGSKFEADANKYKFVWKPTKFHLKLSAKIRDLLMKYSLHNAIPSSGIIESSLISKKITEFNTLIRSLNVNTNDYKNYLKDYHLLCEYLNKSLEYEEKESICGDNRNSYYKTDYDATAMCLKRDYYSGLGTNFHAAYNTQIMVSKGLITCCLVSKHRTDLNLFIDILKLHYSYYNEYPKNVCADAGYGSLDNYKFLSNNNIGNYVKYFSWEGNISGRYPSQYIINEDNSITCLNGKIGYPTKEINRHPKKANAVFYKITGCDGCGFNDYCKRFLKDKSKNEKIFEVVIELQQFIKQAELNLLSIKGIELRVNRSSQVEGAYGVIKQDMMYTRLRRTSLIKASAEIKLICLGYNIRKLFKHYSGKGKFNYWIAPDDLKPETKKKPSQKRLSNKINRKKGQT